MVMIVAVVAAYWLGLLWGIVGWIVMAIMVVLLGWAVEVSADFASVAVGWASTAIGVIAGVTALIALPRFFWRRWDRQLPERENRRVPAPPADGAIVDTNANKPLVAAEAISTAQPPGHKQRRYDGNPRRF
jgi:hypothetical protein